MSDVHLADAPRHVGRRPRDLQPFPQTMRVRRVDVVDPHRHPYAFVARTIAFGTRSRGRSAATAPAVPVDAEEDLAVTATDGSEICGVADLPILRPAEFLEP